MISQRLFQLLVSLLVVAVLIVTALWWTLLRDSSWQTVIAESLEERFTQELNQIYWTWQQQGRPAEVVYKPESALQAVKFQMDSSGKPTLELSEKACTEFFFSIVDEERLNKSLKVSINSIEQKHNSLDVSRCEFELFEHRFAYDINTGEFLRLRH